MGAKLAAKVESGRRRGGKGWFSGLRERVGRRSSTGKGAGDDDGGGGGLGGCNFRGS